jgi:hypothetical protein
VCRAATNAAAGADYRTKAPKDINVLVAGPTGYIGKFVTKELIGRGFNVTAISREKAGIKGKLAKDDILKVGKGEEGGGGWGAGGGREEEGREEGEGVQGGGGAGGAEGGEEGEGVQGGPRVYRRGELERARKALQGGRDWVGQGRVGLCLQHHHYHTPPLTASAVYAQGGAAHRCQHSRSNSGSRCPSSRRQQQHQEQGQPEQQQAAWKQQQQQARASTPQSAIALSQLRLLPGPTPLCRQ